MKKICVNWNFTKYKMDYAVYTDGFFPNKFKELKLSLPESTVLIGQERFAFERTNYVFNFNEDLYKGFHTGFYALQIAQLLGFKEIYLIGYDYNQNIKSGKLHYYEGNGKVGITGQEKKLYLHEIAKGRWFKDFNHVDWTAKIYNCNPKSALNKFEYKLI